VIKIQEAEKNSCSLIGIGEYFNEIDLSPFAKKPIFLLNLEDLVLMLLFYSM